jgi:hypothetical protein
MTQSAQPSFQSDAELDLFTGLVLRYLDGTCSAEEIEQLKDLLDKPAPRELFVQVCRLHGHLHEAFAPRRAELQQNRSGDARTETIVQELSPEDTHPVLKAPDEDK